MGVTRLLLLGLFYTIQMQIYVLFCTRLYKFICKLQKRFKSNALLVVVVWNGSGNDCSPITDGKWKKATRKMFQKKEAQISLHYLKDCCGHESISLKIGRIGFTKSSLFNIKYNPVSFWTLLMFCLLNLQTNACEPNPKTTSSDFNRWKSVTKIFCFHAISTDICLLF